MKIKNICINLMRILNMFQSGSRPGTSLFRKTMPPPNPNRTVPGQQRYRLYPKNPFRFSKNGDMKKVDTFNRLNLLD